MNFFQTNCSIVGTFLQFYFVHNFTFFALESLQTFCILQNVLSTGEFFLWLINLVIGLGFPFRLTSFTAIRKFHSYRSTYSYILNSYKNLHKFKNSMVCKCWLSFENSISFAMVISVLVLCLISLVSTEAATMCNMKKLSLTSHDKYTEAL